MEQVQRPQEVKMNEKIPQQSSTAVGRESGQSCQCAHVFWIVCWILHCPLCVVISAISTFSPVCSLSSNGLRMRVLVHSTGIVRNELIHGAMTTQCILKFFPSAHTHTHTHMRALARTHAHTYTHTRAHARTHARARARIFSVLFIQIWQPDPITRWTRRTNKRILGTRSKRMRRQRNRAVLQASLPGRQR